MPDVFDLVPTNEKPEPGVTYRSFYVFRGPYPTQGSTLRRSFDAAFRIAEKSRGLILKGIIYWHPSDQLRQVIQSKTGLDLPINNAARVGKWSPWALEFYWQLKPESDVLQANVTVGAAAAIVIGLVALIGILVLVNGWTYSMTHSQGLPHPGLLNPGTLAEIGRAHV